MLAGHDVVRLDGVEERLERRGGEAFDVRFHAAGSREQCAAGDQPQRDGNFGVHWRSNVQKAG